MSGMAQPGQSCEIVAIEPHCSILALQYSFAAFQAGGDSFYKNWWEFSQDVRHGHIIPAVIDRDGQGVAQFGVELMRDSQGPYISLLYYCGAFDLVMGGRLLRWLDVVLQQYKHGFGLSIDQEAYCKIVGRDGWRRICRRLGVYMDEAGFISDQQEVIRNGRFRRQ